MPTMTAVSVFYIYNKNFRYHKNFRRLALASSVPCSVRQEMIKYNKLFLCKMSESMTYKRMHFVLIEQGNRDRANDNQELFAKIQINER